MRRVDGHNCLPPFYEIRLYTVLHECPCPARTSIALERLHMRFGRPLRPSPAKCPVRARNAQHRLATRSATKTTVGSGRPYYIESSRNMAILFVTAIAAPGQGRHRRALSTLSGRILDARSEQAVTALEKQQRCGRAIDIEVDDMPEYDHMIPCIIHGVECAIDPSDDAVQDGRTVTRYSMRDQRELLRMTSRDIPANR
jgi:hypothetical protein